MRRFLLLALGMGFLLPTAVNAESYWLVLTAGRQPANVIDKIEMENKEQCEKQGEIWSRSHKDSGTGPLGPKNYVCLVGK